ncbi:MAG: hypothetical protein A2X61_16565 [Ignavibacteria bacterium GWB2_35_12]|nr:MAG: hypothetical protein A2X63_14090 [Ignavibacteria bacterium GWA2_35_8]OGU37883.1 MAG: hypothetical protein A2X61_16565 [Ignavibacteria bacterium GWB2_35_12]OGU85804.1 MAG: hypothetical protein A2220_02215 [Ignavibacteria bacterium RIFOXYA2_FULL_35_10]OGV19667.1 MAG: hypothetical protein A2475_09975 [Ignavibacteria bacterium RIFOXYC2_FULL_35_21]
MTTKKQITTDAERKIIDDFAKEIQTKAEDGSHPTKTVIDFRNDRQRGEAGERPIKLVPTNILRYRKDNGRIAADVLSYEKLYGWLDETKPESQEILRKFLKEIDKENNEKLKNSLKHQGQLEPSIITCDGFLINGNRRKLILEELFNETHDKKFETMKVVILPGKNDVGGPPTIIEIDEIEQRYQLQKDGKSEYTNFNWAVSTQRKINEGYSLERQLKDDSYYANLHPKEFVKKVQEFKENFLYPLECIDRYLESLGRDKLYNSIAEGRSDKEGRWYAFFDYYQNVYKKLKDEKNRSKIGIEEDEVGEIEDIAFKIIRQKDFKGFAKPHMIMRKIPAILMNSEAKKELLKISKAIELNDNEVEDCKGDLKLIDNRWVNKNSTLIIGRVKEAIRRVEYEKETENPLTLLYGALNKLNHGNMIPEALPINKAKEAVEITKEIQMRANELEKKFFNRSKLKDLKEKKW